MSAQDTSPPPAGAVVRSPALAGSHPPALQRLRARRGWVLACAALVATLLALVLLGDALGGEPQGPVSSSYATDAQGLAAWAELLSRAAHPVTQLRTPLDEARLQPTSTVVVLDPDALLHSEGARLLAFVRAGGRLVIGGREPQDTLPALLPIPPAWSAGASIDDHPQSGAGATVAGVREVRSAGEGEWQITKGYRDLLGTASGGALLLERGLGKGELELIADASPLQNRLLASADNAQFALNLAGARGRAVVFVESVHGFGQSRGLAALPERWRLAFAVLLLAGLAWILARGRRLGPAEPAAGEEPPARGAYVAAISLLLRRTKRPQECSTALTRLRDRR